MGLNADERRLLAELQAREAQPDADDDYEVEIYDTASGRGARVPYSQAKGWLHQTFAGLLGEAPQAEAPPEQGQGQGQGQGDSGGSKSGYFGRKQQQQQQ